MRIITLNANGIRSAARKGFFDWLPAQDADVVCLQETKCQQNQIAEPHFHPAGYHCYYFDAARKGYSGVAVYSREKPLTVVAGHGSREFEGEGRYIEARFKNLSVISLYLPSGSSSEERQQAKFRFLAEFMPYLRAAATGTSRTRKSTCATGARTRRTQVSCPKSARGSTSCSTTSSTSMRSAK